ncbi:hypothetical protein DFJ73DRAFT_793001 [Zopfochytrium polystomum]|nr:hypothetical protein DFJ73DRAFT_793001 [Zopfochytrium polystomum]
MVDINGDADDAAAAPPAALSGSWLSLWEDDDQLRRYDWRRAAEFMTTAAAASAWDSLAWESGVPSFQNRAGPSPVFQPRQTSQFGLPPLSGVPSGGLVDGEPSSRVRGLSGAALPPPVELMQPPQQQRSRSLTHPHLPSLTPSPWSTPPPPPPPARSSTTTTAAGAAELRVSSVSASNSSNLPSPPATAAAGPYLAPPAQPAAPPAAVAGASSSTTTLLPPRLSGAKGSNVLPPYKTVICRAFMATGRCFRQDPERCWFAHGVGELREALQAPAAPATSSSSSVSGDRGRFGSTGGGCSGVSGGGAEARSAAAQEGADVGKSGGGGGGGGAAGGVGAAASGLLFPVGGGGAPPVLLPTRFKSELCRFYSGTGRCKYGDQCTFAHSEDELRGRRTRAGTTGGVFEVSGAGFVAGGGVGRGGGGGGGVGGLGGGGGSAGGGGAGPGVDGGFGTGQLLAGRGGPGVGAFWSGLFGGTPFGQRKREASSMF